MVVDLTTKPHSLTHIANISFDESKQLIVNEIVGVDTNGTVRKVPVNTDGSLKVADDSIPTAGNNPALVIDSSDPNNVVLTKTIGATNYQQAIQTSGSTVTITAWSEV